MDIKFLMLLHLTQTATLHVLGVQFPIIITYLHLTSFDMPVQNVKKPIIIQAAEIA